MLYNYEYIQEAHPKLARKISTVQTGFYAENWNNVPLVGPQRAADGVYELINSGSGSELYYLVDTHRDTGKFVRALVQAASGKHLLGVIEMATKERYMELWGEVNQVSARYREVPTQEYEQMWPEPLKRELTETNDYIREFGWDGGESGVLHPNEVSY